MSELQRVILASIKHRWDSKSGLIIALLLAISILVPSFSGLDLEDVSGLEWVIIAACLIAVVVFWKVSQIDRVSAGKVGVGVALEMEDGPDAPQVKADFIDTLRRLLEGSPLRHQFEFKVYSNSVAKKLSSVESAIEFSNKSGTHFLLYGRVRQRTIDGEPAHVLDLQGIVRHVHIDSEMAKLFGAEFRSALPERLIIGPRGDMVMCELAARHIDSVARYVIGTAAALSNDFVYAEQLLLGSSTTLEDFVSTEGGAFLSGLLGRVEKRINELYQRWLAVLMNRYTQERDPNILAESESVIEKLRSRDQNDLQTKLAAATCAFVLRGDIETARKENLSCKGSRDGIWKYGLAFLATYEDDLGQAYHWYKNAFNSSLENPTVPTQCEEFIQIILENEPEKWSLYYALGLINYRAKQDLQSAKRDFQTFLDNTHFDETEKAVISSKRYVRQIENRLSRNA